MQVLVLNRINLPYDKNDYKHYHALRTKLQISIVFSPFVVFVSSVSISDRREWDNGTGVDLLGLPSQKEWYKPMRMRVFDNCILGCMRAYFLYLIIS